jgi:hypothetical protein
MKKRIKPNIMRSKCTDEFVISSNMMNALPFPLLLQLTSPEQKTAQVYLNDISPNEICFQGKYARAGCTARDKVIILIESH